MYRMMVYFIQHAEHLIMLLQRYSSFWHKLLFHFFRQLVIYLYFLHYPLQVINNKGYDGAKADLWSCGVILYVLMAGYLPFEESNLMALYKKVILSLFSFMLFECH